MSSPSEVASELIRSFATPHAPAHEVPRVRRDRAGLGESLTFPATEHARADLLTALSRRRSTRLYGAEPVPARLLADIVAHGLVDDAGSWGAEQDCCPLSIDIVAFRVSGLEPGMYGMDPLALSYTALAPMPDGEVIQEMTIQSEFCDSAAIIAVNGDLEQAWQAHGGHGFRLLMGRAGAAAYAMWLDAVAHGLVGSVFAGFIPASVRLPLHYDGSSRHQLFALALGMPGPDAQSFTGGPSAGTGTSEGR